MKLKIRRGSKNVVCPKCKTDLELEVGRFNSGAKGSSFEAWLAAEISLAMYGESDYLSRTPTSGAMASFWVFDLFPKRIGTDQFKYGIEAKFRNGWNIEDILFMKTSKPSRGKRKADTFILDWWHTTVDDCKKANKIPVLAFKKNREKALVVIKDADFKGVSGGMSFKDGKDQECRLIDFEAFKKLLGDNK